VKDLQDLMLMAILYHAANVPLGLMASRFLGR